MRVSTRLFLLAALALLAGPALAAEEDRRFEVGLRYGVVTAGGEPANDMLFTGLYAEYRLGQGGWFAGGAVDLYTFDFEHPALALGLQQDTGVETIDTTTEATTVSGWIGRSHGHPGGRWEWLWTAGAGFASPDVDDVSGPLEGGGTFDLTTDAGSEILVSVQAGVRCRLGSRMAALLALRADHHIADWTVRDRVSGRAATLDDYTAYGIFGGLAVRF